MVTVAAGTLLIGMPAGPVLAAKASRAAPWDGLFSHLEPRARAKARHAVVPLPKPRPAEAPSAEREDSDTDQASPEQAKDKEKDKDKDSAKEQAAKPAPQPSACRLALTEDIAIAPSIPDIHGVGGCGGEDLVRLEAVVLPDKRQVSVKPAAILRCTMATAIADWIRSDIAPLAQRLGSTVSDLDNFDSFECRGRNRVAGAKLSEHGRANALDVRGFRLADGTFISLTDRTVPRQLRESVLHSACTRFSTVLGPSSDWYHEDHIHLDLMERRGNYRICQWDVLDPLPQKAPLLPAERPGEAPPRQVADKPEDGKSHAGKPETEKPDAERPDPERPDAEQAETEKSEKAEPPRQEKPATKKRRQDRRS